MIRIAISRLVFIAALGAGALAASAQAAPGKAQREFPTEAAPVLQDRFPQVPVQFPSGVKAWRDVTYITEPNFRPQVLDIYVPAGNARRPLVLYIHGGGWFAGHTRQSGAFANFPRVLAALAAEGFTVASLEYRLSGEARFPAQLRDVNAAVRFLRANAAQYRIDPSRVGLWGGSAGGHLAALGALTCRNTALDPAATSDACVQAAVPWYAITDFAAMPRIAEPGSPEQRLFGCEGGPCDAPITRDASPVSHVDASDPPILLIHGVEDKVVPLAQSQELEAAMKRAGAPVRSLYIANVDHSFIGKTPQVTRHASLQAINATFDFFHEVLGVPRR